MTAQPNCPLHECWLCPEPAEWVSDDDRLYCDECKEEREAYAEQSPWLDTRWYRFNQPSIEPPLMTPRQLYYRLVATVLAVLLLPLIIGTILEEC